MKRIFCTLAIATILAGTFCMAATPAKTELSLAGTFVNLSENGHAYAVEGALLFPTNSTGTLLLGPVVAISDVDELTRAGVGFEWNIPSQRHGFFLGASGFYFLEDGDEADLDDHTVTARAGIKIGVGKGAAIKIHLEDVVDGRGEDSTDLSGGVGIIARF